MVILLKIKRRDFFSTRQHSYFGVTHCENSEVQIAVFSKWNMLQVGMETCIKNVILGQKRYFLQSFWDHMDPCAYLPKWSRYVPGMDGFTRTKEPWERAWTFFTFIVTFNFYHKCIHLSFSLCLITYPQIPMGSMAAIFGYHHCVIRHTKEKNMLSLTD